MTSSAWLAATGDIMLTRPPAHPERIRGLFRNADAVLGNLELPLTDRGAPADKLVAIRASPAMARELARMGVDVASLANNHALDFGVEGLQDTLTALDEAGVRYCGTGLTREVAAEPAVVERNGVRIAFMSYSCTVPIGGAAGPERPGMAAIRVESDILVDSTVQEEQPGTSPYVRTRAIEAEVVTAEEEIRRARANADIVVVALHWGMPPGWAAGFQGPLADYQRPLGHRLVEAGANLIVGNHAHAPRGVEVHRGGVIAYSVGNFMFHSFFSGQPMPLMRPSPPYRAEAFRVRESYDSFVLMARLSKRGVDDVEIHPLTLDANVEPVAAEAADAHRILVNVQKLSPDPDAVQIRGTTATIRL